MRKLAGRKRLLAVGGGLALVVLLGAAYLFVLGRTPAAAKPRIAGVVYPLANEFVVNLAGGRYGKVSVALVLSDPAAAKEAAAAGGLPEEPAVRALVTDTLTDLPAEALTGRRQRHALERRLLEALQQRTDVPATAVLLTDIAIQ